MVKNLQCRRPGFDPWVGKIPGGGQGNLKLTLTATPGLSLPGTERFLNANQIKSLPSLKSFKACHCPRGKEIHLLHGLCLSRTLLPVHPAAATLASSQALHASESLYLLCIPFAGELILAVFILLTHLAGGSFHMIPQRAYL